MLEDETQLRQERAVVRVGAAASTDYWLRRRVALSGVGEATRNHPQFFTLWLRK